MDTTKEWKISDVISLIKNKVKESNYLEYKASSALDQNHPSNKRKDVIFEISKDISAFANAGGGTLIYGIREKDSLTIEIDEGLDLNKVTKEWLEQIIKAYIQPVIEGIKIYQLDLNDAKEKRVIYVIQIPQSERTPHQASDKKCYTRRNFRAEPMEIYEIHDVFMRKRAPDVRLDLFFRRHGSRTHCFNLDTSNPETRHGLEINGALTNEGGGEVHYATVTLIIDARLEPECNQEGIDFRALSMVMDGKEWPVLRTDINWGGPSKMPLFRTAEFQLLEKEIHIHFKSPWLEEDSSPFILWDVRAVNMEPKIGFLRFRLKGAGICFVMEDAPEITQVQQNGRNRDFLKNPDLSSKPDLI